MKLRRKIMSLLLCAAMLFSTVPQTAYAENTQAGDTAIADGLCEHHAQHDEACGYAPATEGTSCGYVCQVCSVQEQIDALPTVEEVGVMSQEEQLTVYIQTQDVYNVYEALSEEGQNQIDKAKIDALFEYFNGQVTVAAASATQTDDSVAKVGNTYYDDLAEALNNAKGQTCDILKDTSLSGTYDFEGPYDAVTINLNGHTISGGFTLKLGGVRGSKLNGPGTIYGNVVIAYAVLKTPLTINGNISRSGITNLIVDGSGILCVNGDIGDFIGDSDIANGVTIICTGTCYEKDITPVTTKNINLVVSPSEGGTVTAGDGVAMDSVGNAVAPVGSTVTLNAVANQGYHFKEWQITPDTVSIGDDNKFTMPAENVTVKAVFEAHSFTQKNTDVEYLVSSATCTEAAKYYYSCSCGAKDTDNTFTSGDPKGHNLTHTQKVDATCTTAGKEAYYTCETCDKHFSDADGANEIENLDNYGIIPANGHTWGNWTSNGNNEHTHTCSECQVTENAACSATEWLHDSTHHWQICKDCGDTINKSEHDFSPVAGQDKEICDICGYERDKSPSGSTSKPSVGTVILPSVTTTTEETTTATAPSGVDENTPGAGDEQSAIPTDSSAAEVTSAAESPSTGNGSVAFAAALAAAVAAVAVTASRRRK